MWMHEEIDTTVTAKATKVTVLEDLKKKKTKIKEESQSIEEEEEEVQK